MSDQDKDYLENGEHPEFERPQPQRPTFGDQAREEVRSRVKDAAKDRAKKEVGKQVAKKGTEVAAKTAGREAAKAGAAAAGAVETAGVTAGVYILDGIRTVLKNKKLRNGLIIGSGALFLLCIIAFMSVVSVLSPNFFLDAMKDKATAAMKPIVTGRAALFVTGSAIKEVTGRIDGQVTTGTSRLDELYTAMKEDGLIDRMKTTGIRFEAAGNGVAVFVDNQRIGEATDSNAAVKLIDANPRGKLLMQKVLEEDVHVWNYSQRVTLAEKGIEKYKTKQLLIPGADTAKTTEQVANVKKQNLLLQNNPFLELIRGELNCSGCGDWVPNTAGSDSTQAVDAIGQDKDDVKYRYSTYTLRKLMGDRVSKVNEVGEDQGVFDWFKYAVNIYRLANYNDGSDAYIQTFLNSRKEQSGRLWFNMQTFGDQFLTSDVSSTAAGAFFETFEGMETSKAYRLANNQTGGNGFPGYEKINEIDQNSMKTLYDSWAQENRFAGSMVSFIGDNRILTGILNSGVSYLNFLEQLAQLFPGIGELVTAYNEGLEEGVRRTSIGASLESAYSLGQRVMLASCDGANIGETAANCLWAGAETSTRDICKESFGCNGNISIEDAQKVAASSMETDKMLAASLPLSERLFSTTNNYSFLRMAVVNSPINFSATRGAAQFMHSLIKLPSNVAAQTASIFTPSASAADIDINVNGIRPASIRLETIRDAELSATLLNDSSCPEYVEGEENMCMGDETVFDALAVAYGIQDISSGGGTTPTGPQTPGTIANTEPKGKGFTLKNGVDYSGTPCAPGTNTLQKYTHPKANFTIQLCELNGVDFASIVSPNIKAMFDAGAAAGFRFTGGGFRSYEEQYALRVKNCPNPDTSPSSACSPATAMPGNSQHERGLALDLGVNGGRSLCYPASASSCGGNPAWRWLNINAPKYGFYNFPAEAWHWSTSGS